MTDNVDVFALSRSLDLAALLSLAWSPPRRDDLAGPA